MKMSKYFLMCVLIIGGTFTVSAEQLSKIGVVNFSKIVDDYFAESSAWREIDSMREKYEKGKDEILSQINELKAQKLQAEIDDEQSKALQLDDKIYKKQEYLKEFHSVWQTRINNKVQGVYQSSTFTAEILDAITYIAETKGYSLILRSQDGDILWYNKEVDITELVLDRLKKTSTKD